MSSTPRSRSRSKRSTTNLSNLRLAPLSAKFADEQHTTTSSSSLAVKTPGTPRSSHPSYLQGRSAPTTPGILTRSSSRKRLAGGGGLSRKNSLYDTGAEDAEDEGAATGGGACYAYGVGSRRRRRRSADHDSGEGIPKARSEATLLGIKTAQSPTRRYKFPPPVRRPRTGATTPLTGGTDENWLSHAGATASALVQEGKGGQSWFAARDSAVTTSVKSEEEDEDDDQYEEMAALSASTAQLNFAGFEGGSPVSSRVSQWGSRYGSRNASRRTSRMGSPSGGAGGFRTPRQGDGVGYFDGREYAPEKEVEESEGAGSEIEIEDLGEGTFGLGPLVESLLGFNPFKGEDGVESSTDDEIGKGEAELRREVELKRRREAKTKLLAQPMPVPIGDGEGGEGEGGGWSDAAWLLSVATKAMF